MGIILKDILAVLPVYEDGKYVKSEVKKTNICIQEDKITAVGDIPAGFAADEVIDGADKLVIPGLINAHTHSYMSVFRNVADTYQRNYYNTSMILEYLAWYHNMHASIFQSMPITSWSCSWPPSQATAMP